MGTLIETILSLFIYHYLDLVCFNGMFLLTLNSRHVCLGKQARVTFNHEKAKDKH